MAQQQNNAKSQARKEALKDYVQVNERIEKFWAKYPEGRIDTEILKWEAQTIVMKATIYTHRDNLKPSAVGHAYEKEGVGMINSTSALENCESSCIGRALAILGFEVKKSIASRNEIERAKELQEQMEKQAISLKPTEEQMKILAEKIAYVSTAQNTDVTAVLKALGVKTLDGINTIQYEAFNGKLDGWKKKIDDMKAGKK